MICSCTLSTRLVSPCNAIQCYKPFGLEENVCFQNTGRRFLFFYHIRKCLYSNSKNLASCFNPRIKRTSLRAGEGITASCVMYVAIATCICNNVARGIEASQRIVFVKTSFFRSLYFLANHILSRMRAFLPCSNNFSLFLCGCLSVYSGCQVELTTVRFDTMATRWLQFSDLAKVVVTFCFVLL